jgi:hypothetical protein
MIFEIAQKLFAMILTLSAIVGVAWLTGLFLALVINAAGGHGFKTYGDEDRD